MHCRSSRDFLHSQNDVQINYDAISVLSSSQNWPAAAATRLPILFLSDEHEAGYIALHAALDFGSSFDTLLLPKRKTAKDVIQFGILGLAMNGVELDAPFLTEFTGIQVYNFFAVDTAEEHDIMPGVTMSRPGPLAAFANRIKMILNHIGHQLHQQGHNQDLGTFVMSLVRKCNGSASTFVESVVSSFPAAFEDRELGVQLYRKAQLLAVQLMIRFRVNFDDAKLLNFDSGAEAIASLRAANVILCHESLRSDIEDGEDLSGDKRQVALRAAAIVAGYCAYQGCQDVCKGPFQLSMALVREYELAKENAGPRIPTHKALQTSAY